MGKLLGKESSEEWYGGESIFGSDQILLNCGSKVQAGLEHVTYVTWKVPTAR